MPVSPHASATAVAHVTPKDAWAISGPLDPTLYYPRFGPLPAVVGVRDQSGPWDAVGQTRRLLLSDGGHVVETITDADSPTYFAYELSDFQRVLGKLVTGARAEWRFGKDVDGTSIDWTYTFFPRRGRHAVVAAIVALFWAPYMRRVLPPIAAEVQRQISARS